MTDPLAARPVVARVEDLTHGAGACVVTRRWPLRTLAAYLFEGRECDEVRALLAAGAGTAHGARLSWPPLQLTVEEFTEIEHTFPQARPDRVLDLREASLVFLAAPGVDVPSGPLALRREAPPLVRAADRARYVYFDYGPWADVYEAPLSPDGARELLDAASTPSSVDSDVELVVDARAAEPRLRIVVPRAEERAPWRELPP